MSPKKNSSISDHQSENPKVRRGRPEVPPALMLKAADALFGDAHSPGMVTMDAIAAEAGVGKGTLFRAFGSREGLLNALWAAKLAALRTGVEEQNLPRASAASLQERAVAFLDSLLTFKLKNRQLIRALELGPGLLRSEHYKWMHRTLQHFIEDAAPGTQAAFSAHVLLSGLHIDLVEEMIAGGLSLEAMRQAQAAHARAVIGSPRSRR